MQADGATVLFIDDDAEVRDAVGRLLRSAGWKTETFASALDFLERPRFEGIGCILLDVKMPSLSGPDLHERLRELDIDVPVIYLSGQCDIPTCVSAMKHGAVDVLEKPADADTLLQSISTAVDRHRGQRVRREADADAAERVASLSGREREVLEQVILGRLNKQIAADLGITEKTVKLHRGRMLAKMRVRSVAQLVRLCDQLGASQDQLRPSPSGTPGRTPGAE